MSNFIPDGMETFFPVSFLKVSGFLSASTHRRPPHPEQNIQTGMHEIDHLPRCLAVITAVKCSADRCVRTARRTEEEREDAALQYWPPVALSSRKKSGSEEGIQATGLNKT